MPIDINVPQLIINKLTKEQYSQAHAEGAIVDTELYLITDDDNGANNDNYKNAILLDDGALKNSSGEDITEDIKAIVAPTITGNVGDFVVIGEDGKITAKTIVAAEGVSF